MDVFQDLIDELKQENLLEHTVIDDIEARNVTGYDLAEELSQDEADAPLIEPETGSAEALNLVREADIGDVAFNDPDAAEDAEAPADDIPDLVKPSNGREFYKKRAIGEMSNLQMVEHVLTGVEREYLKIVPKVFDDFAAKKALNAFLQVAEDENSPQHAEAEFAMMEETEAWCTALAARDREIPVASVRQYCENSRPALSSQALVALARFYRNLPHSQTIRSKFDFVITRLFSRPAPENKRVCLFTREEMLSHISLLYKEWSSVPLYSADDDESKISLTALSFDELASEAEMASSFDLLIASDFFGRLTMFKDSVSELFFAPNVTAAAIDCNIRVGNAYITLIDNERTMMDDQSVYTKFESVDNLSISDATARTLEIVDILRKQRHNSAENTEKLQKSEGSDPEQHNIQTTDRSSVPLEAKSGTDINTSHWNLRLKKKLFGRIFSINRWLLATAVIIIAASVGIFAWTNIFTEQTLPDTSAQSIELSTPVLRKHLKTARISGQNFYGLLLPSWETLTKEKRQEYLQVVFDFAQEKGCTQVSLLNSEGKAAGFASTSKSEVIMP